jgi:hypothetical protein
VVNNGRCFENDNGKDRNKDNLMDPDVLVLAAWAAAAAARGGTTTTYFMQVDYSTEVQV